MKALRDLTERAAWIVFTKELRELFRDRRAVFFAFILPLVLYPLLFLGLSALPRAHLEELQERTLSVAYAGDDVTLRRLEEPMADAHLEPVRVGEFQEDDLRSGKVAACLELGGGGEGGAVRVDIHYLQSSTSSVEAKQRLMRVLGQLEHDLLEERFARLGYDLNLDALVEVERVDLATREETSAASLGRLLPFLLILLLLTGGSFAAFDLVAGEKERGTLETLCVQGVSSGSLVSGKFLVVLLASLAAVVFNLTGLLVAMWVGIPARGLTGEVLLIPSADVLVLVLIFIVPLAVLSSAVLLGVSAYARSYRETQSYLLPLTLVALVPVGLAASPQVSLSSIVAFVPVANVALAIREVVVGHLEAVPLALVLLSTSLYAALALRGTAALLRREDILLSLEPPPLASDTTRAGRERRGLFLGAFVLLLVYFAGSWLQSGRLISTELGLLLTLWIVVLAPALLYPLLTRQPLKELLALRRPKVSDLALAVCLGFSAALLVGAVMELQNLVLPLPESLRSFFGELLADLRTRLGLLPVLFLFALSPGICEELLWRGAFQGEIQQRGRTLRTVILVGLFFGLFHMSVHRFVPTALVGALLATVRLRTGSIYPCMLLHATYNASTLLLDDLLGKGSEARLLDRPVLLLVALLALLLALRGVTRISHQKTGQELTRVGC